jgi:NAD(P)-dependent dehydrogenase (short-subunit alcohol dehydrogenase family)
MRLQNKAALITGGAGSMGSETARRFAAEGANVAVADLNLAGAEAVAQELRQNGSTAVALELDVCQAAAWETAVAACETALGRLDILVNIAGANMRVSFEEQTEAMWDTIVDTNLKAYFLGTKAVVPALRRAGGGAILNTGSLATFHQGGGSPAYGVSKLGLLGLTRSTASAYAADGIRCVLVCPGHVDTNFIRGDNAHSPNNWSTSIDNPDNYQRRVEATPLGRLCTPLDVANAFVFCASEEASMITGSTLTVDGGAGI